MNLVRQFLNWWFGQLEGLFRSGLRESGSSVADATVIAPNGPLSQPIGSVAISSRRDNKETPLGRFDLAAATLDELAHPLAGLTVLRLAEADILEKTVVLPLAAERHLSEVLALEMDRETPFSADDLFWTYRVEARDRQTRRLSVRLAMVPRAKLAGLLGALARVGVVPARGEVAAGTGRGWNLPLGDAAGRARNWGDGLFLPAAACCALLGLVAVALPFARQAAAFAAVDREIAAGRSQTAESETLLAEIAQRSAAIKLIERERGKTGRLLEVLAAATRVLPDNAFLTEMTLRQRKITLTGRSGAAARLIGALAADGSFRNPEFAAPVTRIEPAGVEIFTITVEAGP
ncbi:MAG TPA: PilN domain-containing protein [Stellaceae bacterium]|nr:PilN domain-containing protein [Stellaceae bacterium]